MAKANRKGTDMADSQPHQNVPFKMVTLDKPRKLRFTTWSVVEMEQKYGRKVGRIAFDFESGNFGIIDAIIILRAGLLDGMPKLETCEQSASLEAVCDMYDAIEPESVEPITVELDKPRVIRFPTKSLIEMELRYGRIGLLGRAIEEHNVGVTDNMQILRCGLLESTQKLKECPDPQGGLRWISEVYDAAPNRKEIMDLVYAAFRKSSESVKKAEALREMFEFYAQSMGVPQQSEEEKEREEEQPQEDDIKNE